MKYNQAGMIALLQDSRFIDMGNLPSNFFPYKKEGITKLYARPFKVAELRLISRAAVLKDVSYLVRAIDLCISMDANYLTIGDFYYVMMWLRMHSMPKTPYIMEWECLESVVVNRESRQMLMNDDTFKMPPDEENWEIEPCGTANNEVIHISQIETISLEDDFPGLPEGNNVEFDFPRAGMLQDIRASQEDPGLKMLVQAAQWIKDGLTIEEKVNIMDAADENCQVFDDAMELQKRVVHGVVETVTLTCRKCLFKARHQLQLDPVSFFR